MRMASDMVPAASGGTAIYPLAPLTVSLWRMLHPLRQRTPLSGEGARLYGGRWNMKGWPALYFATDAATAVAEYYQGLPKPGMLVPYRLAANLIADLTDAAGLPVDHHVAAAMSSEWKRIALLEGQVPPSWDIAQRLIAAGAHGALVPSAQNSGGRNLVVWRWQHAAGLPAETRGAARLTVVDPERALS